MNIFNPVIANGAQTFSIPGGVAGSTKIYMKFASAPSAGTVTFEIQRPGSADWTSVQNGSLVGLSSGSAQVMADGGFSVVRLTFSGLVGGSGLTLAVVENATGTPASDLLTDGGFGSSRRIRVDQGRTWFFAGRMFRSFLDAGVPVGGPPLSFRLTSPVDFILWSNEIVLTQGAVKLELFTKATPSGTWTQAPIIGVNRMLSRSQPYYVSTVTLESGGSFTGGTLVDPIPVRTPGGNQNADNVGGSSSERGLPPGVYYGRISTLTGRLNVNDDARFTYKPMWEERP